MKDRLIELLKEIYPKTRYIPMEECREKIADAILADGWMRPPCKSGDVLWYLDYGLPKCFMSPEKVVVQDVLLINGTMLIRCEKISYNLRIEDIGKSVFLTREEAEAKLKEGAERC